MAAARGRPWGTLRIIPTANPTSPDDTPERRGPLSFAQSRLWVLRQLEGPNPAYHHTLGVHFEGALDAAALARCLARLLDRHEALRTRVVAAGDEPLQAAAACVPLPLGGADLRGLPPAARAVEAERWTAAEAERPFDLAAAPLLRLRLLALAPAQHTLLLTFHHLVADGWSLAIFLDELAELYRAAVLGREADLAPLPFQYLDFARQERRYDEGGRAALALPVDRPQPAPADHRAGSHGLVIAPEVAERLAAVGARAGVTLALTLFAATAALLARCGGQDDLVLGTVVANRDRREVEPLVGCFADLLALRLDLAGEPPFTELLGRVRRTALAASGRQAPPFESPVPAAFTLESPLPEEISLPGLAMRAVDRAVDAAALDWSLSARRTSRGLEFRLLVRRALCDAATGRRMLDHLETLLAAVAAAPEAPLPRLPLLAAAARRQLLNEGRARHGDPPASVAQEHLWHLDRALPGAPAFNISFPLAVAGAVEPALLERAFARLVARHESLRTGFYADAAGTVRQRILPALDLPLLFLDLADDLAAAPPEAARAAVAALAREEARLPFDVAAPPLLRATLVRLAATEWILLLTVHHVVADGGSLELLVRELAVVYDALADGRPPALPAPALQFADYAVWERRRLAAGEWEPEIEFWRERLAGEPPVVEFPGARPAGEGVSVRTDRKSMTVPRAVRDALFALGLEQGASAFMTLLAAFAALVGGETGARRLRIATVFANRDREELERVFGLLVNTLLLDVDLAAAPTFPELLRQVRGTTLAAFANGRPPFEAVARRLEREGLADRLALCRLMFLFQRQGAETARSRHLRFSRLPAAAGLEDPRTSASTFDLTLLVEETGDGLDVALLYKPARFEATYADHLLARFRELLARLATESREGTEGLWG
jgi:condensation domain-containing protein